MHGRECFAAVDLAYRNDVASVVLLFDDGSTICRFYIPRTAYEEDKCGKYREFCDMGYMTIAGEKRTDYDAIKEDLRMLQKIYPMRAIAFDPWNASQFAGELEDEGWNCLEFRQGFHSMNEPAKETEARIIEGKIFHNNPVLDWMAANCSIKSDPSGNIKPIKPEKQSTVKVDGIVCLVMCVGLSMTHEAEETNIYAERGMISLADYL